MISIRKNKDECIIVQNNKYDMRFIKNRIISVYLLLTFFCIFFKVSDFYVYFYMFLFFLFLIFLFSLSKIPKKVYVKIEREKIEFIYFYKRKKRKIINLNNIKKLAIEKKGPFKNNYSEYIYYLKIFNEKTEEIIMQSIFPQELRIVKKIILNYKNLE